MAAPKIDLYAISSALSANTRAAENRRYAARGGSYDNARIDCDMARSAEAEFRKLEAIWPRAQTLIEEADRSYDRHVLSAGQDFGPEEGCSCHINPPCGFCTSQSEDEDEPT